ncbi:hypothetical protein CCACVL1_29235, partial [Corchorus capsularis]
PTNAQSTAASEVRPTAFGKNSKSDLPFHPNSYRRQPFKIEP